MSKATFKLVWNQVSSWEWQAGGMGNLWVITYSDPGETRTKLGYYSLKRSQGDGQPKHVRTFSTLKSAQARAEDIINSTPKPAPPTPIDFDLPGVRQ